MSRVAHPANDRCRKIGTNETIQLPHILPECCFFITLQLKSISFALTRQQRLSLEVGRRVDLIA